MPHAERNFTFKCGTHSTSALKTLATHFTVNSGRSKQQTIGSNEIATTKTIFSCYSYRYRALRICGEAEAPSKVEKLRGIYCRKQAHNFPLCLWTLKWNRIYSFFFWNLKYILLIVCFLLTVATIISFLYNLRSFFNYNLTIDLVLVLVFVY